MRRPLATRTALIVVAVALVFAPRPALACPEARALRLGGAFAEAERQALACLDEAPDDAGTWLELSRALGLQTKIDPALGWVERGLARYPDDTDMAIWRVRLLAWSGRPAEARATLDALVSRVPALRDDRDTALLAAEVRYLARDWRGAEAGYTDVLARWPDDPDASLKRALARDALARQEARFDLSLEQGIISGDSADLFITRAAITARVWRGMRLGAAGEVRARDGVAPSAIGYGLASYHDRGFAIEAGLGGSDGGLTPALSGWIEPGFALADPVWLALRYWRLDFGTPGSGVNVLGPSAVFTLGPIDLDLRYWLGLEDDARVTHAAMARVRWSPLEVLGFELGGGGGTATDYLEPRADEVSGHWLALAGVRVSPSWRHRLSLGYLQRHEATGQRSTLRHELSLAWRLTL